MKGTSLPVNVIVIIIIALLVLVGLAVFFSTGMQTGQTSMSDQQLWQKACSALKMRSGLGKCDQSLISDITVDDQSFTDICKKVIGTDDEAQCCEACCGKGNCES